jgi:hypothetical protein
MPNLYMISMMNSTALAAVMEAASFTLTHFANLSTATKISVNQHLASFKGPVNGYGLQLMRRHMFLASKKLATITLTFARVGVRHSGEPKEPLLKHLTHE